MPKLKEYPSLIELQEYQRQLCQERGWDKSEDLEVFLLFSEEVGELAKAIRNKKGLYIEKGKEKKAVQQELESEFADVLGYLLELANHFEVDLTTAFHSKEAVNAQREWDSTSGNSSSLD